MISLVNKGNCCGCNACGDVCPGGAITFAPDEEGFLYPHVDAGKCSGCGLCEKVCPQLHAKEALAVAADKTPKCWAAV
ncbi:MAG: 4Fe-4S dicluster domain-containing protein, partial [Kiritimatiellae bacterium]|nr:4Fe-4S dicluster domain-containing protein [Kiritimatiellia bacterium]